MSEKESEAGNPWLSVIDSPRDYNKSWANRKVGHLAHSTDYLFGLKAEELTFRTLNRLASVSGFVRYRLKNDFVIWREMYRDLACLVWKRRSSARTRDII